MVINKRTAPGHRVQFGRPLTATITAIDGTWKRDCVIVDVSNHGAKLQLDGGLKGLDVDEFFLAFSGSGGQTQRHCEMRWCKGTEIGVKFKGLSQEEGPGRRRFVDGDRVAEGTLIVKLLVFPSQAAGKPAAFAVQHHRHNS